MRLLDVYQLKLKEFPNVRTQPPYAILSHTWGDGEVSLQQLSTPEAESMPGYAKITKCCEVAIQDGFEYVWIDTCCIDKTSSAELSEAINSMYLWYQYAAVCYAYLPDVQSGENPSDMESLLSKSRWFTRGWTLQELLAPKTVIFYDHHWVEIGTKRRLQEAISRITGIPHEALLNEAKWETFSIAARMSWAAKRETTRVEDTAYCLMGIFDVNMPTLYGEGWKAFIRLQQEIMKSSDDQSLFAWTSFESGRPVGYGGISKGWEARRLLEWSLSHQSFWDGTRSGLLASSPQDFWLSGGIRRVTGRISDRPFSMTGRGLHISLPMQEIGMGNCGLCQVVLNCDIDGGEGCLSIYLQRQPSGQHIRILSDVIFTQDRDYFHNTAPTKLYVKEIYPNLFKDIKFQEYQLHFVDNTSSQKGYTVPAPFESNIKLKRRVRLLENPHRSFDNDFDMSYVLVQAIMDPSVQTLVAIGASFTGVPKLFCTIRSEASKIQSATDAVMNLKGNSFSAESRKLLFDRVFCDVDSVTLGEHIVKQLPNGQNISITFRNGPGSSEVALSRVIVEFKPTLSLVDRPPLPPHVPRDYLPTERLPSLTLTIEDYKSLSDAPRVDTNPEVIFYYPKENWPIRDCRDPSLTWTPTPEHRSAVVGLGTGVLMKLLKLRLVGSDGFHYELIDPPYTFIVGPRSASTMESAISTCLYGVSDHKPEGGYQLPEFKITIDPPRLWTVNLFKSDKFENSYEMSVGIFLKHCNGTRL